MSEVTTIPGSARTAEPIEDPEVTLERLKDPTYLPSYGELVRLGGDHVEAGIHRLTGRPEGGYRRCEIFTREYITGLADWLEAERSRIGSNGQFTVLEVGAGDGNLSYFLQREFADRSKTGIHVICTDSGDSRLQPLVPEHHLEYVEAGSAVQIFKPEVVLQSWMPWALDLTDAFRVADSVEAYVLIGPADSDVCGRSWETWGVGELGNRAPLGWQVSRPAGLEAVPPYRYSEFEKERLELGPQLNYKSLHREEFASVTTAFRRQRESA